MTITDRRRALMGVGESTIDTTPKIMQYDVKWNQKSLASATGYCVTERYFPNPTPVYVPAKKYMKVVWGTGGAPTMVLFSANGTNPIDYWGEGNTQWHSNAVSVSFTLETSKLSMCYAYMTDTGEVLFAGENTPYFGKRNIND
jgi:hypothetical protein